MVENRQAIADMHTRDFLRRPKAVVRHWARSALFSLPAARRLLEREPDGPDDAKTHWDGVMSQTHFSTYLGGTIQVDACNAITATLIKYRAPENPAVLDVGCCGGTLALALSSFSTYLGTDVSLYAISVAKSEAALSAYVESGRVSFQAADLRDFTPANDSWDVVVFNEVLYYLKSDQAVEQVKRYAAALKPSGIICVSMKNDGKSRAIFRMIARQFKWVDGMLYQQKATAPGYSIGIDRERPAFLTGVFGL